MSTLITVSSNQNLTNPFHILSSQINAVKFFEYGPYHIQTLSTIKERLFEGNFWCDRLQSWFLVRNS